MNDLTNRLNNIWIKASSPTTFNVLLLGETGAGKSTTVNAFANYLKLKTFETAKSNVGFEEMIPASFVLPNPQTGEPYRIESSIKSENEVTETGKSSTQDPSSYLFKFGDKCLRLIDTPGIGDTRGAAVDSENFDKIMAHLHKYDTLHGILILMKANETRANSFFKFCITELLTHLHEDTIKNMVICFTFSRNSFYLPGDGYALLRSFLQRDLPEVNFTLVPGENCFFIDNEAYRILLANKQGYPIPADQENDYRTSWNKSVEQTTAMWKRIMGYEPHELKKTLSLNNARKLIQELAEPMARLQSSAQSNIDHMSLQQSLLNAATANREQLLRELHIDVDDLESRALDFPRTVCTATKCTRVVKIQGQDKMNYETWCHDHCYLNDVGINNIGHPALKGCAAFGSSNTCKKCKCEWQKHMHIRVEYVAVKRAIIDSNRQLELNSAEGRITAFRNTINILQKTQEEYENEYEVIAKICTKFAYLLKKYGAITTHNRFLEPYYDLLIDEEQQKVIAIPGHSNEKLNKLKLMKDTHLQSVAIFTKAIEHAQEKEVKLEDIEGYKDELLRLKHSGPQFQQIMDDANWAKAREYEGVPEKKLLIPDDPVSNQQNNQQATQKESGLVSFAKQFWFGE